MESLPGPIYALSASIAVAVGHTSALWWLARKAKARNASLPGDWFRVRATLLHRVAWLTFGTWLFHAGVAAVILAWSHFDGAIAIFAPVAWILSVHLIQRYTEHAVERSLGAVETTFLEEMGAGTRTFVIGLAGYVIYFSIYQATLFGAGIAGDGFGLSMAGRALLLWTSVPLGIFLGVLIVFWLSPLFVRLMFPSSRVVEPAILKKVGEVFARAKVPVPEVWILELEKYRSHNALVAGVGNFGPKWARRSLFITRSLIQELPDPELTAVLAHEAAHLKLKHIPKRLGWSVAAVLIGLVPYLTIVSLAVLTLPRTALIPVLALAFLVFLGVQIFAIRWQVRRQELEADACAVRELGAGREAMGAALIRITKKSGGLENKKDPRSYLNPASAHPTTTARIEALQSGLQSRFSGRAGWAMAGATAVLIAFSVPLGMELKKRNSVRLAAESGEMEKLRSLLAEKADINGRDFLAFGKTPLFAAAEEGDLEIVRFLLDQGALPDHSVALGFTPLMAASANGYLEIAQLLVERGANPERVNHTGERALDIALRYEQERLSEWFSARDVARTPASERASAARTKDQKEPEEI